MSNTNLKFIRGILLGFLIATLIITTSLTWARVIYGPVATLGPGDITSSLILDGTIVNADINSSAGIAYSKLNLTGSIVDADIATGANIAFSKIATGTWVGAAIGTQYGGTGQNWSTIAQGGIPYFSAAGTMSVLAAGTSGYFLKTQGAGANPVWAVAEDTKDTLIASTDVMLNAPTDRSTAAGTYTKLKEIRIDKAGTIRVYQNVAIQGGTGYAYIYKNGSPVAGTEHTFTSSQVYNDDISVNAGDLIQGYYKNSGGYHTYITDFQLRGQLASTGSVIQD